MFPKQLQEQLKFIQAFADTISGTFKQFAQLCRVHVKRAQNGRPEYAEMQNQLIQERKKRMELEEKFRERIKGSSGNEERPLPNLPNKPKNAFTLFVADQKERLLRDMPELAFDKIVTLSAIKWKRLPEEQKAIYEKKFIEISKLYEKRGNDQDDNNETDNNVPEREEIVKKEDDHSNHDKQDQKGKNNNEQNENEERQSQNHEQNMGTIPIENEPENQATLPMEDQEDQEPRPLERMLDLFHTPALIQHSGPNQINQEIFQCEDIKVQSPKQIMAEKQPKQEQERADEGKQHLQKTEPSNITPSVQVISQVVIESTIQEEEHK